MVAATAGRSRVLEGGGSMWEALLPTSDVAFFVWAAVAVAAGLWWWFCWSRSSRNSWPPGPRPLPIIGNLHLLGEFPHRSLARLSRIHGPLMSLRLGSIPLLVASSAQVAKLVLHTLDKSFAGRPIHLSAPRRIMGPSCPNLLFHQSDAYWKVMRQLCVSEFFSNKRLDHFRALRMREVRALLRSVLAAALQGSNPLVLREKLHVATNNIIACMSIGKPLSQFISVDPSEVDITSALLEAKGSLGIFDIGDYIPWLAWLDLQGFRRRDRQVVRNIRAVLQKVIDGRRQDYSHLTRDSPPQDFLDLLLSTAADPKHKDLHIDDAAIRAVLLDMFVAGTDTSVVSIEWAFAELLANPEKLRKLQHEVREVVGASRIVEESDLPNLPYLKAVVNEALRLHPVGPLLVPHRSVEACEIQGYRIPAGTVVYVNAWAIQRDPDAWKDPSEFRPERFLGSALMDAIPGQHFELIPFGAGRRSCPAWKLGLLTVQTVLGNLVHAFDWTRPAGEPISFKEKFGIAVTLEEPLIAVPSPRLHPDVLTAADEPPSLHP